jgi:hypothetical protein
MSRFDAHAQAPPTADEQQHRDEARERSDEARYQRQQQAAGKLPPAAAPRTPAARAPRRQAVATAREDTLSTLDRAVEQLVRDHTSGALIDAAWAAAHRLFQPAAARA